MQPASLNLTVYKGSTFSQLLQWKKGEPPVAVDLTGFKARMQIRKPEVVEQDITDEVFVDIQ